MNIFVVVLDELIVLFFFFFSFFHSMCMDGLPACMYVHPLHA